MADRPMILPPDDEGGTRWAGGRQGEGGLPPAAAAEPEPAPAGHREATRSLASQLPDWDLVPPTEFVRRRR